ncbi:MAG: gephyrin-like molybdotransferase Glp [Rhodothermaceae bacterium]
MIPFEEAIEIVEKNVRVLGTEKVKFTESLNRILAQDVHSDMDMPPFDKSAMDGFACRSEDIKNELELIEVIPAGKTPEKKITPNTCSKIMTGAMIPLGADCVIIVEETEETAENKIKFLKDKTGKNICKKGEDVKAGDKVLEKGVMLTSRHIAPMAMVGCVEPEVYKLPKIGIIATGDEIVDPQITPASGQIRNTNSYQLIAQCKSMGIDATYYGVASDEEEVISEFITKAKLENDLILLTGGVSMGDFDLVPGLLKKAGFNLLFDKVAVQPGKPTVFGVADDCYVFGLPGNPVSSYLIFELFAKTLIYGMMGRTEKVNEVQLELAESVSRKKTVRKAWFPVEVTSDGKIKKVDYHGSAHINALAGAFGIIHFPVGVSVLEKGSFVNVRQL